jgi:hypothetical protein
MTVIDNVEHYTSAILFEGAMMFQVILKIAVPVLIAVAIELLESQQSREYKKA